ncbi:WD repeatcontaining protein 40A, putative, partial [Acanthamoeba castellanii str. Neff]
FLHRCIKVWDVANLDVYWITLIDRRSGVVINQIRSVDQEWGVRSLNFLGQKTISIAFYDMCADKYRPIDKHSQQPYLTLGDGWIAKDEMYRNYLAQNHNQPVPNAVYTHCYDPTFTRLFVGAHLRGPSSWG